METRCQVKFGRASLAVEVHGSGPPIVFLHAAVTDRRMWRAEMNSVATSQMAIAYDRRGFGETVAEEEQYSSVADLFAIMDATSNGAPAILVGCSQGGRIGIDAALAYPARVRGLVLIAPNVTGEPLPQYSDEIKEMLAAQTQAVASGDLDRISQIKARLWLDGPLASENRVSGQARELFHEMHAAKFNSPPAGHDIDDEQNYHRLREIAVPTLILWGDLDFPHIQDRCQHLAAIIPNAAAHELRGTAHPPSLENSVELVQQLAEFSYLHARC